MVHVMSDDWRRPHWMKQMQPVGCTSASTYPHVLEILALNVVDREELGSGAVALRYEPFR